MYSWVFYVRQLCFDLQMSELKCYMDVLSGLCKALGCVTCTELVYWHSEFLAVLNLFWELTVS